MGPAGPAKEATPFVSVIIPVFNDDRALRHCLEALRAQTYPSDRFEVLVVDNGSTETDPAMRREFGVRWLEESQPGSYAARNKGLAEAKGQVIAFTDADTRPDERWLERGVATLKAAGPGAVLSGRVELTFHGPPLTTAELHESLYAFNQRHDVDQNKFGVTANLLTWKSTIDHVGPFDARLRSAGDHEWGLRAHAHGHPLFYAEDVVVRHPARRSSRALRGKIRRTAAGTYVRLSHVWQGMPPLARAWQKTRFWAWLVVRAVVAPPWSLFRMRRRGKSWPWRQTAPLLGLLWSIGFARLSATLRVAWGHEAPRT